LEWGSCPIIKYFLMDFIYYASQLTEIYDLYQWLWLQSYELLMMDDNDTSNVYSNIAVK
jgi:hypothetical protein